MPKKSSTYVESATADRNSAVSFQPPSPNGSAHKHLLISPFLATLTLGMANIVNGGISKVFQRYFKSTNQVFQRSKPSDYHVAKRTFDVCVG